MDGTLVDTEPYWMDAEQALMADFGLPWGAEDGLSMLGLPLLAAAEVLRGHGVPLAAETIVDRLLRSVVDAVAEAAPWQPGAWELLAALGAAGVPCALVTMSYRTLAEAVTRHAPEGTFAAVITGDEVVHGKPHPEPYLRAAAALSVDITACVAIEDSPPGVGSALASGARTLGVEHAVPVDRRPGLSRVGTLSGIGLGELARITSGETIDLLDEPAA
jgi:HAD superfamily hydrolase (TIGR01509 family)